MNATRLSPAIANKIKSPGLTDLQQSGRCFIKPLPANADKGLSSFNRKSFGSQQF